MGKKHKKHKSEKHAYEEYGERPLKLVLKVAGNEVTTGSASFESVYDNSDYNKPKDKKKKKKKREDKERSSFGSPVDDKGKKKMTKKRKGQRSDCDDREQNQTPIRSELDKMEEKEQSPLQVALNQLIRQLQRKDPSAFFSFPVTDLIAPGYSSIIKRSMDFSTIRDKVKKERYQSLEDLKVDFRIMCENAMIYNKPETIYHKAARKLLHSGMKILSSERLESLKQSIEFMVDLDNKPAKTEDEGSSGLDQSRDGLLTTDASESSQSPSTPRLDKDSKDEALKAEKELEEIRRIISESGGKLSNRGLQCELTFDRLKSDGSTTLGILNPADLSAGDVGFCPVKLGMMSNRLQCGVNTLQGFREDKRNRITPVSYMNYGPYTSYAPTYDSSFSNVSKEDSDLIYSFYGEESSQGTESSGSIAEILAKSDEHMFKLADNLLDVLTNGAHSKTLKNTELTSEQEPSKTPETSEDMEVVEPESSVASVINCLSSVITLGLEQQTEELSEGEKLPLLNSLSNALHIQLKLDETTKLIRDLQEAQNERLSTKQPPNIICLLAPTTKELQLAEKVTGNLAQLTCQVAPGDVSSVYGVRKAMGVSLPPEPAEPLLDLTTVQEMPEPMETLGGQNGITV